MNDNGSLLPWLTELDADDRREALAELHRCLLLADPAPLREALHAWQTTVEVMRNPLTRAILTSPLTDDDFVDAPDPLGPQTDRKA